MLEESDLDLLTQELNSVDKHWENLGRGLGHDESNLSNIHTSYSTSHDCLKETLRRSLKSELRLNAIFLGHVTTWRNIVDALRASNVKVSQLADQLEAKYCPSEFTNNNILLYFSEYNAVHYT